MAKPTSRGRRKLEMKKITNKTRLGVTFTKRRTGIFKKANELVTLCGATLAIIIFSPGRKAYSFGHPNVYTIFARFLNELFNNQPQDSTFCDHLKYFEEHQRSNVGKFYTQYNEIQKMAEIERNKAKEEKQAGQQGYPMDIMGSKEQLSLSQARELHAMLKELKIRVSCELERRSILESMEDGGNLNNNSVNDDDQLGVMFNCFDSPGTSNIPGPSCGPWNP